MARNSLKHFILRWIVSLYLLGQILVPSLAMELMAQPDRAATDHPNPLPLATIRPDHPRLWINSDNIDMVRSNWNDPAFQDIVFRYRKGNVPGYIDDIFASALNGLLANDVSECRNAISGAQSIIDSGFVPESTGRGTGHTYVPALVFDWCYDELVAQGKKDSWASRLEQFRSFAEDDLINNFGWHEIHRRVGQYVSISLAIEGESGVSSRLRETQNVLQNWQEMADEVSGDGGYRAYFYQGQYHVLPVFMYAYATDRDPDLLDRYSFAKNLADWHVYRLAYPGNRFTRTPGDISGDEENYIVGFWRPGAYSFFMLASEFVNPVAQWLGNMLASRGQEGHYDDELAEMPAWLSIIFYDPGIQEMPPGDVLPEVRHFDKIGMVAMRSGWNYSPSQAKDVTAWFYNGPATSHSTLNQNHFQIWRGADDLAIMGGSYMGTPGDQYYQHYFGQTIARNTLLFSPANSNNPDIDGGQIIPNDNNLHYEKYPISNELVTFTDIQAEYRGEITHFSDNSVHTIVSGDATLAYRPQNVISYIRDFVYLKPDVFLIRDRFETTNVDKVRWLIHSREKPEYQGNMNIILGSNNAGILETSGNSFDLVRGDSRLDVYLIWPSQATLRFIGGSGYEAWVDGRNSDPRTESIHSHGEEAIRLTDNQWRTEIEVTPQEAGGNIITAFFVSQKQTNIEKPVFTLTENGNTKRVVVAYKNKSLEIIFPPDNVPALQGIVNDNQPPSAPKNLRINPN